jgi:hypothetical protein
MVRQSYYTEPWRKEFQLFENFASGMNTTSSDDNMVDSELRDMLNISLDEKGSMTRRTGYVEHLMSQVPNAKVQGFHRHFKSVSEFVDMIFVNGTVEIGGVVQSGITFQSDRTVDAVQWGQRTYIATGSGLYTYKDGEGFKKVEPKKPDPLEALYIGTNALADDPNAYLEDGLGSHLQLTGVTFSTRYGTINNPFTLTAFVIKQNASDVIEYQFEYRFPFMEAGAFHMGQDWSTSKTWTHKPEGEGDMQFRIRARKQGTVISSIIYDVPKYQIKPAPDPDDIAPDYTGIHTCNRILLHWERIILYGDTKNFDTIYISHLKAGNYFPMTNTLAFETPTKEPLNALVRFRDYIIAFTDTTVQALFGKSPRDYSRRVLNTAVGCIAPKGVTVLDNYVAFVSLDGIYYLKSVGYVEDKANVARLDERIVNIVPKGKRNAVMNMFRNELHVYFPDEQLRFRYSRELNAWTKDNSALFNVVDTKTYGINNYLACANGRIALASDTVYTDVGHVYKSSFKTKYLSFGIPHHPKKMKELQITARGHELGMMATVRAYLDGVNRMNDVVEWKSKFPIPNGYNTFEDKLKIAGKCLRVMIEVEQEQPHAFTFLDFGIVHKIKKP